MSREWRRIKAVFLSADWNGQSVAHHGARSHRSGRQPASYWEVRAWWTLVDAGSTDVKHPSAGSQLRHCHVRWRVLSAPHRHGVCPTFWTRYEKPTAGQSSSQETYGDVRRHSGTPPPVCPRWWTAKCGLTSTNAADARQTGVVASTATPVVSAPIIVLMSDKACVSSVARLC